MQFQRPSILRAPSVTHAFFAALLAASCGGQSTGGGPTSTVCTEGATNTNDLSCGGCLDSYPMCIDGAWQCPSIPPEGCPECQFHRADPAYPECQQFDAGPEASTDARTPDAVSDGADASEGGDAVAALDATSDAMPSDATVDGE